MNTNRIITVGPGLAPSLVVGIEFAKALSMSTGKPIIPVNHMLGHLYSPFQSIENSKLKIENLFPSIALIVSGGHTMLVLMSAKGGYASGGIVDCCRGGGYGRTINRKQTGREVM